MSNYPGSTDDDVSIPALSDQITELSVGPINALRSAVFALQSAIGTNPQGSHTALTSRLAAALNDDGTLKAAALVAAGLIALPVVDSQVGVSAAIQESKLDLDFTTQSLKDDITSNDTDIASLQNAVASTISKLALHIVGTANKHDGYDISIVGLVGQPTILTVEDALNFIHAEFLAHKAASTGVEHNASVIQYAPLTDGLITATNVQAAVEQIDGQFIEAIRKHYDNAHSNGVSNDSIATNEGYGNTNSASLKLTRYQSADGVADKIKVGLINAASVRGKGFNPGAINAANSAITIVVKNGTTSRTLTVTGLDGGIYPAAAGRISLDGIVDYLNLQFALSTNYFPVSAFSFEGELVLQHNVAATNCTIKVSAPSNSAITALGFADIVDTEIFPLSDYIFVVGGTNYAELRTISTGSLTLTAASSILDLGVDITGSGLNLKINTLIHIINHTDATGNGTFRIVQVSPSSVSPNTSIDVATTLPAGTFTYIIYNDIFDTDVTADPKVYDFYIDNTATLITEQRATVVFGGLSGVKIIHFSPDFPVLSSGQITLSTVSGRKSLKISEGALDGLSTLFDIGYIGQVKVYGTDNVSYVIALVSDLAPVNGTNTISNALFAGTDNRLYLGSANSNGSTIIELPFDYRNVGLTGNSAISSEFLQGTIERDLSNLRVSGFIRGFEASANDSSSIFVNGGTAYVQGHYISRQRQIVDITRVATVDGTYNLLLSKQGNIEIYLDGASGFGIDDVIANQNYITISQVIVASSVVSTIVDSRFLINDIDFKLPLTVDDRELGAGTFRKLDAAVIYSANVPDDVKRRVEILSDYTASSALTILAGREVVASGALTVSSTLTLAANASLTVLGASTFTGNVVLGAGSKLNLIGASSFAGSITLSGSGASLYFGEECSLETIVISASNCKISGSDTRPLLVFDGSATAITVTASGFIFDSLSASTPDLAVGLIALGTGSSNTKITNSYFYQDYTINEANWSSSLRTAIQVNTTGTIDQLVIDNCEFYNLATAIFADNNAAGNTTLTNAKITNCNIHDCGTGIFFEDITNSIISKNSFVRLKSTGVRHGPGTITSSGILISENTFSSQSTASTTFKGLDFAGNMNNCIISENTFSGITCSSLIKISLLSTVQKDFNISKNQILNCTTGASYAIDMTFARANNAFNNNIINGHTGNFISATDTNVSNNIFHGTSNTDTTTPVVVSNRSASAVVEPIWSGNTFSLTTTQDMIIGSIVFSNNNVLTRNIVVQNTVTNSVNSVIINNNKIKCTGTAPTAKPSIQIKVLNGDSGASTTSHTIFSGNVVAHVSPTSSVSVLEVATDSSPPAKTSYTITDNVFSAIPSKGIIIGSSNNTGEYNVSNNQFEASSSTTIGVHVETNNATVSLNRFFGSSIATAAIFVSAGRSNVLITDNLLNAAGAGGQLITTADANPTSVFISNNKNHAVSIALSALNGVGSTSAWTAPTGFYQTSTASTKLFVPLNGLPVGAKLTSITLYVSVSSTGQVSASIGRRNTASLDTTIAAISSTVTSVGTNYHSITISPSTTEYIRTNNEYMLSITAVALPVQIGQVIVNIVY